jgi:hypothetical protein
VNSCRWPGSWKCLIVFRCDTTSTILNDGASWIDHPLQINTGRASGTQSPQCHPAGIVCCALIRDRAHPKPHTAWCSTRTTCWSIRTGGTFEVCGNYWPVPDHVNVPCGVEQIAPPVGIAGDITGPASDAGRRPIAAHNKVVAVTRNDRNDWQFAAPGGTIFNCRRNKTLAAVDTE